MAIKVPNAVRHQAVIALSLHKRSPVRDVGGIRVAETLSTAEANPETIRRMRRFFTVNARAFESARQLMHTLHDSALMRSWMLHGGQAGKVWAERVYETQLAEGGDEDPWVELLRTPPTEIYERLNFGAWSWEYGMDVRMAARFVEEYQRTHGCDFRFDRAFGDSTESVKRALIRRVEGESNPFKQLSRAVMKDAYRKPALLDLRECKEAIGLHALFNWPNFIGLTILAAHAPKLAESVWADAPFPWRGRSVRGVMDYAEPVGDFVSFFHPDGACYLGEAPNGLAGRLNQLLWQIHEGEVVSEVVARDTLTQARMWTAKKRAVRGLGHTLLEAWARRDWGVILEALPLDSPVRAPFEAFAGKVQGTWLAPTGL